MPDLLDHARLDAIEQAREYSLGPITSETTSI